MQMKKIVSFVLAAVMLLSLLPTSALAAETAVPEKNYAISTNPYMTRLRVDLNDEPEFQVSFQVHWDGEEENRFTPQMGARLMERGKIQVDDGKVWSWKDAELTFATEDTKSSFHTFHKDFIKEFYEKDTFTITVTTPEGYTVRAEGVENQMSQEAREKFKASLETDSKPTTQYTVDPTYTYVRDNWGTKVMRIDFKEFGSGLSEKTAFCEQAVVEINGHSFGTMKSMGFTVNTYYDFELSELRVIKDVIGADTLEVALTAAGQTTRFTIKNELTAEQRQEIIGEDPMPEPEPQPDAAGTIGRCQAVLLKSNDHTQESMSGPTMKKEARLLTNAKGETMLVLQFEPATIMGILAYATDLKVDGCTTEFVLREDNSGVCLVKMPAFEGSEKIFDAQIHSSVMNSAVALQVTKPAETTDLRKALQELVNETEALLQKGTYYEETKKPVQEALESAKQPEDVMAAYAGLVKAAAGLRAIVQDPFVGDTVFHVEAVDTSVIGQKSLAKYVKVEIVDGKKILTAHYNSYLDWDGLIYMDGAKVLDQDGREIPCKYTLDEDKNGTLTFEMPYVPASGIFDVVLNNGNENGSEIRTKLQMNYATMVKGPFKTLLEDAVAQYGYYTDADWSTRVPMEKRKDAYTESSWAHFEKTLAQCKADLELGVLTQEKIDSSVQALKAARKALVYQIQAGSGHTANTGSSAFNAPYEPFYPSDAYAEYPEIVGWGGSKVVFGKDGAVYRVLDNGSGKDGSGKLLLMSENLRVKAPFTADEENVDVRWQDSQLRKEMNGRFYEEQFSEAERAAIVKSVIETYDYMDPGFGHPAKDVTTLVKTEDYIFAPSMAMMTDEQYGFGSNDSRITPKNYSLRDVMEDALGDYVTIGVSPKGRLNGMYELASQNLEAPACLYLDAGKILMTVDAATGIPQKVTAVQPLETNLWKLVMQDDTLQLAESYEAQVDGRTVRVDVGDAAGTLMAVVVEGEDFATGTIKAYGKVEAAGFTLPAFDTAKDKLYMLAIRDEEGKTAYASQPALVKMDKDIAPETPNKPDTEQIDGTYKVEIALWHETDNRPSMGDAALTDNRQALVTVKDGRVTRVEVTTSPVAMGPIISAITQIEMDGQSVEILRTEKMTTKPAGHEIEYIKHFAFHLPDGAQPDGLKGITYLPVRFKAPDTPMGDQLMNARIKLDWSTAVKTDGGETEKPVEPPKPELPAVQLEDPATGIKVYAEPGVFTEEVLLVVTPITSGQAYANAAQSVESVGKKFKLYDIHFENRQGEEVQPNGKVTVSYKIPEGYDASKLVLYRINSDGTKTRINGTVENGYYQVIQKQMSTYALVEAGSTSADPAHGGTSPQTGDTTPMAALLGLALGSAAGAAALVIGKKRRIIR